MRDPRGAVRPAKSANHPVSTGRRSQPDGTRDDERVFEEDRADRDEVDAGLDRVEDPIGDPVVARGVHPTNVPPFFTEASELAIERMKLAARGDDLRFLVPEAREQSEDE